MNAVNLIPAELRRSDAGGGHSGGLVYVALGLLAALVVLTAAWTALGKIADDRKAEAAQLGNEAAQVEARAGAIAHYGAAAKAAKERIVKVRTLATSRFDWPHTFREVSRMLPDEAWVTSMTGTVGSQVQVEGGGNPLRDSVDAPALELVGCTRRQDSVARLMASLRAMDGVTRVALSSSEKADNGSAGGASSGSAGGGAGSDCRSQSDRPQFNLVVFFGAAAQPAATPGAATPAAGAPGSTPPAPGATTPSPAPSTPTGAAQ